MKLVIDASVILKIALVENEEDQQIALAILKLFQDGEIDITLPNFWLFEVGNTLIRKNVDFEELYSYLLEIGFRQHNFNTAELIEIGNFAKNFNVSFYDASYHMLAKLINYTFVTADERYFEKTKKAGNIVLLKNLKI